MNEKSLITEKNKNVQVVLLTLMLILTLLMISSCREDVEDIPDIPFNEDPTTPTNPGGGGGNTGNGDNTGGAGNENDFSNGPDLPTMPYDYTITSLPAHLTTNALPGPGQSAAVSNDNAPANNPITDEGATLGRVLFYDTNLSANGSISCASCHRQEYGFSDPERLSRGFEGGLTGRHSMSLVNAAWYDRGRFFWDERAATLEEQVLMPFQDAVEMGMTLDEVVAAVEAQNFYANLFSDAFGSSEVTSDRIARALAQFVRSMISVNSKYDTGRAMVNNPNQNFPNFTASENRGKGIFIRPINQGGGACIACHTTEAFINPANGSTNNGIDNINAADQGIFGTTGNQRDRGAFKVPSLKSIALTAPYMHDGRLSTLEEVVEHYNSGVQNHPNLSPVLRGPNGQPLRLNLSNQEKADLVAFLRTLTDDSLVSDQRFSDPFE